MAKKMTRGKAAMEKLRLKARTKYLESGGAMSISQIAKEVGTSRQTASKWKKQDNWEKDLAEVRQEVDAKVKKTAASNLYDSLMPEFKEMAGSLRIMQAAVNKMLMKKDKDGQILRDENGVPQINDNIPAKDMRHISAIVSTNLKTLRLITGQSTENINQNTNHSGQVEHEHHEAPGVIDTCMEKMASGELSHSDGQDALQKLAEAFQEFQGDVAS